MNEKSVGDLIKETSFADFNEEISLGDLNKETRLDEDDHGHLKDGCNQVEMESLGVDSLNSAREVSSDSINQSLLSLTAQLEKHHLANSDTSRDASVLFIKPVFPAPKRKTKKRAEGIDEVQLKAGKKWRRSLSQVKKAASSSSSLLEVGNSLSNPRNRNDRSSIHVEKNISVLDNDGCCEIHENDSFFPTPEKSSLWRPGRISRSSFRIVPNSISLDPTVQLHDSIYRSDLSETLVQPPSEVSPLQKLLAACSESEITSFDEIYSHELISSSTKVGEGAYGEVFLLGSEGLDRPVLKVVPIDGEILVNGVVQTRIEDMLSEVIISKTLSQLRQSGPNKTSGFVEVRGIRVFQGPYPEDLLLLWDHFNEKNESENDRPDNLPHDQKFIALEFNNGGKDLEKFTFRNASQALQAWKQVVHSLAVAEEEHQFEHRDLHWGNVLIRETTHKFVEYSVNGDTYQVGSMM